MWSLSIQIFRPQVGGTWGPIPGRASGQPRALSPASKLSEAEFTQ
jgi:hypothetical protein